MRLSQLGLVAVLAVAASAQMAKTAKTPALESFDPVLLVEGKEVPGKDSISLQHGRFLYYFSSAETKAKFEADPDRYGIQLDGACARMGPPVGGSPDAYTVHKGKIYVFGSDQCYKTFVAAPEKYLESEQPKPEWNPTAANRAAGKAELDRIVAAMGGAAHLDAVKSYNENRTTTTPAGERTVIRSTRMPDSYRLDTRAGDRAYGTMITAKGAFSMFREPQPIPPSFTKVMLSEMGREPLPILLSRTNSAFDVYDIGDGSLRTKHGDFITVLRADPVSHRIQSIAYTGRGREGTFGKIEITYADYREAGGLQLPHRATATFDGQPDPTRAWTVTSYDLNPADINARFSLP